MNMSIELLVIIGGFVITFAAFLYSRLHDAENRGRLMQRVDELEKTLRDLRERTKAVENGVACHDTDISKIDAELASIKSLVEKIDTKLDRIVERRTINREEVE